MAESSSAAGPREKPSANAEGRAKPARSPPASCDKTGAGGGKGGDPAEGSKKAAGKHELMICKGCLYYSSKLRSDGETPNCIGIGRSVPRAPDSFVRKYESLSVENGRGASNFKYACFGYSMFLHDKDTPAEKRRKQERLPFCFGMKLLMDRTLTATEEAARIHRREEDNVQSRDSLRSEDNVQSRDSLRSEDNVQSQDSRQPEDNVQSRDSRQPEDNAQSQSSDDKSEHSSQSFTNRFRRNAGVVAYGVGWNLIRVGYAVKNNLADILSSERRRPK